MKALGITDPGTRAPAPCHTTMDGLILTTETGARARLRLQVACLYALESFVPFAPRYNASETDALDWLARNPNAHLDRLRGKGQLSITLTAPTTDTDSNWLRGRATQSKTAREIIAAMVGDLPQTRRAIPGGLRCDVLVAKTNETAVKHRISQIAPDAPGWSAAVTGLWPGFSFCEAA